MGGSANPSGAVQPATGGYTPTANAMSAEPVGVAPVTMPGTGPNVYNTASNLYNQAAAGPNISQFFNPYTSAVTDATMQGLERQRQMQMNDIGAQATRAGAFGGSRHGVAEALTNQGFAEQGASTLANLNQQGFNTALAAAQGQQGIQSGLAQQGFGFGNTIGAQQWQQGQAQQTLNQALIDAIRAQYAGFTGAPATAASNFAGVAGGVGAGQGTTTQNTQNNPGALQIISAGLGLL